MQMRIMKPVTRDLNGVGQAQSPFQHSEICHAEVEGLIPQVREPTDSTLNLGSLLEMHHTHFHLSFHE
jgi:hypothetical protein